MTKSIILLAIIATIGLSANGQTTFRQTHPRRAQVNSRLNNQNRRIHREVREGEMSHKQAAQLHRNDRSIRHEERAMAAQNHGHITRGEQGMLNRQENRNSSRIGR